jgi:nitrate reductase NapE
MRDQSGDDRLGSGHLRHGSPAPSGECTSHRRGREPRRDRLRGLRYTLAHLKINVTRRSDRESAIKPARMPSIPKSGTHMSPRPDTTNRARRRHGIFAFLFLPRLMPALAVATVGSYGLDCWLYQIIAGPPGPPALNHVSRARPPSDEPQSQPRAFHLRPSGPINRWSRRPMPKSPACWCRRARGPCRRRGAITAIRPRLRKSSAAMPGQALVVVIETSDANTIGSNA